jgi:hypothetical protein
MAQKSSTLIQKYKVVQHFPKFIASVPNTFAETINPARTLDLSAGACAVGTVFRVSLLQPGQLSCPPFAQDDAPEYERQLRLPEINFCA